MSNEFSITPTPPTSIKLAPGEQGRFSFTVNSLAAPDTVTDVVLSAIVVAGDSKAREVDWLVIEPRRNLPLSGGKTETVTIAALPTETCPRGQNSIKLVVANKARPNDVYTESSPVVCEVVGPSAGRSDTGPKVPWWLIITIGGVVVAAGAGLLIWKLWPEPEPEPVRPALKANGAACASSTECRSQSCVQGVCRPVNLALRKEAKQSSTHGGGDAGRAVDGNTDGDWTHNSVTHTESTPSAYWQVDLGAVADIDHVVVYNRTDCCPERLSNFDVLVSDDGTIWRNAASGLSTPRPALSTPVNASARFVRVQLRGTDYLSLAEVEVLAR